LLVVSAEVTAWLMLSPTSLIVVAVVGTAIIAANGHDVRRRVRRMPGYRRRRLETPFPWGPYGPVTPKPGSEASP
jgi:hypothetical protein